jgi:thymidylate synthase ThyX
MFKCEILCDSLSPQGDRLTTFKVTYPRIIHAEMLRHRMFSRNVASSRAIPFKKMVKDVEENPFIPIAWQKDHKGMQGNEYWKEGEYGELIDNTYKVNIKNCSEALWIEARDKAIKIATVLNKNNVTKQLCNRLLEPFVWTTELITTSEEGLMNFFELRCPQYEHSPTNMWFKSKKDAIKFDRHFSHLRDLEWFQCNKSQAEIHIQAIAELMWDAYNESIPKQLRPGEWHIPFGDNIGGIMYSTMLHDTKWTFKYSSFFDGYLLALKIATARCARLSYETLGDNPKIDYEADIKLHDRLVESSHWSPFEHCARVMTDFEYENYFISKEIPQYQDGGEAHIEEGWCRNFKGFIQYRHLIESK